ncbi:MAG: DUF308 domain-containing protein [Lachnospiraceae bacterium]|nr:DUF308 domain-containing protein [Lachnospiraceae bacterium]
MEFLKKLRMNAVINGVLTILMGLLFLIFPYSASNTVAVIAGIVVLCIGIFDILRYFTAGGYSYYVHGSLFMGVVKCVLGIFIFTHTDTMVALFSYVFSIFIIVSGVTCMENSVQIKQAGVSGWLLTMVLSVLVTAAGIAMLFYPIEAASTAAFLIGIVLLVDGATELLTLYQLKRIRKDFFRALKDIQDEIEGNVIDQ